MSDYSIKQYKAKDIHKVCSKENPDELPSQFDKNNVFDKWDRLIVLKNGTWILQSDELNEEIMKNPDNEIHKLLYEFALIQ